MHRARVHVERVLRCNHAVKELILLLDGKIYQYRGQGAIT
jgi:hypothetical protein